MTIYRGPGGSGDATNDATVTAVAAYASQAATSAENAATSASTASTASTSAASSATAAAGSASNAASSASNAATSATNAAASASAAATSATSAASQVTAATTQANNAATSATAAATSAANAATSATAAQTAETNAETAETNAETAYANTLAIFGSAAAVTAAVSAASTSATNAANSATAAATSATNAATSATSANSYAAAALNSANNANAEASEAQTSANAAAASAAEAANYANAAEDLYGSAAALEDAVDAAQASATASANSATNSGISAGQASTSAANAATSATNAANSATQAATSAASAAAIVTGVASNRPSIRPSLLLDFQYTKQLDPRITFSRPTTATYYDGKTVVKAEENLLKYSQEFNNAAWSNTYTISSANTGLAPDGTNTAQTYTATATTSAAYSYQVIPLIASTYVVSVYAKANTSSVVWLYCRGSSTQGVAYFDLSDQTSQAVAGTVSTPSGLTIVSVGNGWFRVSAVFTVATADSISGSGFGISDTKGSVAVTLGKSIYLWGAQIEQRSTVTAYTPTTTAPITNYIPALQTAVSNDARFDHDPVTGESKGLLIEEQRTNLLTYSAGFGNTIWTSSSSNVSVTANTAISPEGTLTGCLLLPNTTNGNHFLRQDISGLTNAATYTVSIVAKAAGLNRFDLLAGYGSGTGSAVFDLSSGTVVSGTGAITSVGNGWYRCSTQIVLSGTTMYLLVRNLSNAGASSFAGDGYSGIYIWGAQLEAGSFPTSYIPTVASQVTRSADSASMTGSNFSSWYRADEGTFFASSNPVSSSATSNVFSVVDATLTNANCMYNVEGSISHLVSRVGGTTVVNLDAGGYISGTNSLVAGAYKRNDYAASLDGGAVVTDTDAAVPVVDRLFIGASVSGVPVGSQTIKRIAYYPKRLSNTELQGLTS